jgi:hypothetical protein
MTMRFAVHKFEVTLARGAQMRWPIWRKPICRVNACHCMCCHCSSDVALPGRSRLQVCAIVRLADCRTPVCLSRQGPASQQFQSSAMRGQTLHVLEQHGSTPAPGWCVAAGRSSDALARVSAQLAAGMSGTGFCQWRLARRLHACGPARAPARRAVRHL